MLIYIYTCTPNPNFLKSFDLLGLYDSWDLHATALHNDEVTHKFPLPVSNITGTLCGGLPTEITPIYYNNYFNITCVFL